MLIADSNTRLSQLLVQFMADEPGFRVVAVVDTVDTVDKAVEVANRQRPDIVLLSQRLEGKLVDTLCEHLRSVTPKSALVAWSHDVSTGRQGRPASADAVVERSTTFRRFVRHLRHIADRPTGAPAPVQTIWADEHLPPVASPRTASTSRELLDNPDVAGGLLLNCDSCGVQARLNTDDVSAAVDEARTSSSSTRSATPASTSPSAPTVAPEAVSRPDGRLVPQRSPQPARPARSGSVPRCRASEHVFCATSGVLPLVLPRLRRRRRGADGQVHQATATRPRVRMGRRQQWPMRSEGHFDPRDRRGTVLAIKDAAAEWGVAGPAIGLWSQAAAERVPPRVTARWRLEYDPRMGLLSFEVWADGKFVYGSDDIVSKSGGEITAERSDAGVSRATDSHYIASEDRDRRNLWVVTCGCGWRGKPYAALASARFYFHEHQQAAGSGGSMPHQG